MLVILMLTEQCHFIMPIEKICVTKVLPEVPEPRQAFRGRSWLRSSSPE